MNQTTPPDLPGYDFLRPLGHGGFADVYLLRQHLPSRDVAVKVLRTVPQSSEERRQFENEANRMAMLSSHPGIVTIYEVGLAPDGRPFLTMEFCPHPHFGEQARNRPLTVSRALDVGVKVAAAVETAHQAGIRHRDIKPANILLTAYDEPALTDFGIAGDGSESVNQGVSLAFAAPEVLRGVSGGDEQSDIYSLAATIYALLAGRAPFNTGTPLSEAELIQRTLNVPLPPTGRPDVPPSLERILATGMARDPENRFDAAASFGRALQAVQTELGMAQTPLAISAAAATSPIRQSEAEDPDDRTRYRSIQQVDPTGSSVPRPSPAGSALDAPTNAAPSPDRAPAPAWPGHGRPAPGADASGMGDRTVGRPGMAPTPAPRPATEPEQKPNTRRIAVAVAGVVVVLAAVAFLITRVGGEADDTATTTTVATNGTVAHRPSLRRPERVKIEPVEGGGQLITWTAQKSQEGDLYRVTFTDGPAKMRGESSTVDEEQLQIETDRRLCASVELIRGDRISDSSQEVCSR